MNKELLEALRLWRFGNYKYLMMYANHFSIDLNHIFLNKASAVTIYPAVFIENNNPILKMIIIPENNSNAKWNRNIIVASVSNDNYSIQKTYGNMTSSSVAQEISKNEAELRINKWHQEKEEWLKNIHLFEGFYIQTSGLNNLACYKAIFSMNNGTLDLVLTSNNMSYYNSVKIYEPHPKVNFHVLNLI